MQSLLLQKAQKTATELRANAKIEVVDPDVKKTIDDRNAAMMSTQSTPNAAPSNAPASEAPATEAPKDAPKP